MKAIEIKNPGPGYALAVADIPTPKPGPGEALIRNAAAGLNRADLAQAMGGYPPPPGASDIKMFRVWVSDGLNNIRLTGNGPGAPR